MKYRTGFVSNSSDSSFILDKNKLTQAQITAIFKHGIYGRIVAFKSATKSQLEEYEKEGHFCADYGYFDKNTQEWSVREEENLIHIDTSMDNFDLETFMHRDLKVPKEAVISSDGQNNQWYEDAEQKRMY